MQIVPAKTFSYRLIIGGFPEYEIQDVDFPELSYEEVVHGSAGNVPNSKTPGKPVVGDLVFQKLKAVNELDFRSYQWYAEVLLGNPQLFLKTGTIARLDALQNIVETWTITDVWIKSIKPSNFNTVNSENLIETCTLSVGQLIPDGVAVFKDIWESITG